MPIGEVQSYYVPIVKKLKESSKQFFFFQLFTNITTTTTTTSIELSLGGSSPYTSTDKKKLE